MFPFVLALLLILAGILFWRRYSTHLRRSKLPPGPFPLPIIGNFHLLGALPHRALHKLSQKYGPIMSLRLGSVQAVVVSSPAAAKLFLGTHDAVFASRPKIQAAEHLAYGAKGMTFSEYGPYWRSVRKLCTIELLSAVKINRFAWMRREEMELMVEEIRAAAAAREAVNLSEKVGELMEGMTLRMLFGKKGDDRFVFKSLLREATEIMGAFNLADYFPVLAPFDLQGLTHRTKSIGKAIDDMLEAMINEHEQVTVTDLQRPNMDFIDILLFLKSQFSNTHDDLSNVLDKTTMKAIVLDMIAATIETSKSSIDWVLSALIRNPRVMKKLQKEITYVVGDVPMVHETDLTKLSYLHMVVKETFRLYPIAPLLVPHESIEDISIDGYNIPKKTRLLVNIWGFGRDPNVWSENWQEFFPERFLDQEIDFHGRDFELIPFGAGRRGCPGENLGLALIGLTVANLVHCFDWTLPNDMLPVDLDMNEKFGLSMPRAKPLLAIPTYRPHNEGDSSYGKEADT